MPRQPGSGFAWLARHCGGAAVRGLQGLSPGVVVRQAVHLAVLGEAKQRLPAHEPAGQVLPEPGGRRAVPVAGPDGARRRHADLPGGVHQRDVRHHRHGQPGSRCGPSGQDRLGSQPGRQPNIRSVRGHPVGAVHVCRAGRPH